MWARAEAVVGADVVEAAGGFAAHVEGVVAEAQGAGLVVVVRVGLVVGGLVVIFFSGDLEGGIWNGKLT